MGFRLAFVVNCIKWVLSKLKKRKFVFNHSLINFKEVVTFNSKSLFLGLVIKIVVSSANNIGEAISLTDLGRSLM